MFRITLIPKNFEAHSTIRKIFENKNKMFKSGKGFDWATAEQLALHEKVSAQQTLLKHIFYGVISLIICMWSLVFVGWFTEQETIEREMAFFERIILVFIGIVGGAISSFFDVRNFALSSVKAPNGHGNGNGNGNGNGRPKDTD